MATIVSCRCLNIKIRLSTSAAMSSDTLSSEPISQQPLVIPATIAIGGITIEHRILIATIVESELKWVKCINCDTAVYGFQDNKHAITFQSTEQYHLPPTAEIYLKTSIDEDKIQMGEEVEKLKEKQDYSPAFRIRMIPSSQPCSTENTDFTGLPLVLKDAFENIQTNMLTYINQKKLEVEARIADYTALQMAKFDREQEEARLERKILWKRICQLNQDMLLQCNNSSCKSSALGQINASIPTAMNSTSPIINADVDKLPTSAGSNNPQTSPPNFLTPSVSSSAVTSVSGSLPLDRQCPTQRRRSSYVPPNSCIPNTPIVSNASTPSLPSGDKSVPTSSQVKTAITAPPRRIKSALSLSSLNGGTSMSSKNLRVTFADQPVEFLSRKSIDSHKDTQGVFSLDGFEDQVLAAPIKPPLHDDDTDESDESDAEDFIAGKSAESKLTAVYSTSLPIDIMSPSMRLMVRNARPNIAREHNEGQVFEVDDGIHSIMKSQSNCGELAGAIDSKTAQELLDDDTVFVAPHLLSASLRANSYFERPSSMRKVGLM